MMADTRVKKTMGTGMGVSKRRAADPRNGRDELQAQRLMLPGLAACAACGACYDAHDGAGAIKAQGLRAHPSVPSSPAPAAPPPAPASGRSWLHPAGSIQPTSRFACTVRDSPALRPLPPASHYKPLQGCPSSLYTLSPRRSHSSPCATTTCLPAPPRAARRRVKPGVARHLSRRSHSRRVPGCESAVHRGRHARRCRLTLKLPPVAVQHARVPGETKGTYVQCARQPGVAQHSAHPPRSNALQLHSLPIHLFRSAAAEKSDCASWTCAC